MQGQSTIEEKHCNAESLHIAVPSAYGLQFLNGAVHPLCLAVVASHTKSIDDTLLMAVKHLDNLGDFGYSGIQGTLAPHRIERECLGSVHLASDDVSEIFLDTPSTGYLVVGIDDGIKLHLLLVCELGGVLQEEVSLLACEQHQRQR